jgi:hypothetical protein
MNENLLKLFEAGTYQLGKESKERLLMKRIKELNQIHQSQSEVYDRLSVINRPKSPKMNKFSNVPFVPVQLFKSHNLTSINKQNVIKTLTSSGTSGQSVSKIYIDKETASLQTKALVKIVKTYLGSKRLPMIIIDSKSIFNNPTQFSARAAGILGMANFGVDHFYALDKDMKLDAEGLNSWLDKYKGVDKFMFGFTFMIWEYLYKKSLQSDSKINLSDTVLLHSGGWKKLIDQAVTNQKFKDCLKDHFMLSKIHNYYGMVESLGSIYVECEKGFLHTPSFSEILIRRFSDWSEAEIGEEGVIQVISALPQSYPGHSILTEDLGTIHGIDDCTCGRKGRYFTISGRIPKAELRGCSDTHAKEASS